MKAFDHSESAAFLASAGSVRTAAPIALRNVRKRRLKVGERSAGEAVANSGSPTGGTIRYPRAAVSILKLHFHRTTILNLQRIIAQKQGYHRGSSPVLDRDLEKKAGSKRVHSQILSQDLFHRETLGRTATERTILEPEVPRPIRAFVRTRIPRGKPFRVSTNSGGASGHQGMNPRSAVRPKKEFLLFSSRPNLTSLRSRGSGVPSLSPSLPRLCGSL